MQHLDGAVAGAHVDQLEQRRAPPRSLGCALMPRSPGRRGRRRSRPGRCGRPRRSPLAIIRPKSSTWIVSQTSMTSDMSCSTRQTARPSSRPGAAAAARSLRLLLGLARRGLVEQQHGRLDHERPRQLHHACLSGRDLGHLPVGDAAKPDQLDDPGGLGPAVHLLTPKPQLLRISPATRTLSRTESDVNSSRRWNVRATPSWARLWGGRVVTSRPSKRTWPLLGDSRPVTTLNSVVLPAPFGPISPVMWPGCDGDRRRRRARRRRRSAW